MPKPQKKSVLLDTSFLITLFDDSRPHNANAKKYYQYFIENEIAMFISSIVASEYEQKGSIKGILDTNNFISSDFSMIDGIRAGDFSRALSGEYREGTDPRAAVKDDIKLLAQCSNNGMDYIVTDDSSTLAKYTRRLNELNKLKTQVITMNDYDISIFNGGQMALEISLSE